MLRSYANNVECCCMLLRVVRSCSSKFETGQTFGPTTARPNISFVPWSPMLDQCWTNVGSIFTPLPTLLLLATHAHYTRIQRIRVWDHPTMHCRSHHCWELLHPFAYHCRNGHNNVGSCCVRLQVALRNSTIITVCNLLEIFESLTTCASG